MITISKLKPSIPPADEDTLKTKVICLTSPDARASREVLASTPRPPRVSRGGTVYTSSPTMVPFSILNHKDKHFEIMVPFIMSAHHRARTSNTRLVDEARGVRPKIREAGRNQSTRGKATGLPPPTPDNPIEPEEATTEAAEAGEIPGNAAL